MRGLETVDVKDLTQLSYTEAAVTILLLTSVTRTPGREGSPVILSQMGPSPARRASHQAREL